MYQYKRTVRGSLGYVPRATARNLPPVMGLGYTPAPRMTARNIPPAMGWTGGFTIPDNPQRFSMQTCSGSAAVPMDPSSDLICGRSAEVDYLNNIGCVTVGFQGSHHCLTGDGNQGLFHCCPPGVLDQARAAGEGEQAPAEQQASVLPAGVLLGVSALAITAMGWVLYSNWKEVQEERERFEAFGY